MSIIKRRGKDARVPNVPGIRGMRPDPNQDDKSRAILFRHSALAKVSAHVL
jgi:hypothetical protein